jgi:demethylmenaquinone methyltransferase/2-methoxy-6-polyprenyl-1,4-benzoquinol methylase
LVVLSDINASMLGEGRRRLIDEGAVGNIVYAQIDAEQLPFRRQHL